MSKFDISLISNNYYGLSVTLGGFPSKFLKCSFYMCVRSSGLASFCLVLGLLFLLLTSFTVYHAIRDCLPSTEFLTVLIWFWLYSVCSFRYTLVNSHYAFFSLWALGLIGFLLLHRSAIFTLSLFSLTTNVSHGTLCFALSLIGMHSAAASMWALTKFSYSSFGVCVSDIPWSTSNWFLSVIVYLSQISLLLTRHQSLCAVLIVHVAFLHRHNLIFAVRMWWSEDKP